MGLFLFSSQSWAMDPPAKKAKVKEEGEKKEGYFAHFPKDILNTILLNLDPHEWAKGMEVSKHWNNSLNDITLWKRVGEQEILPIDEEKRTKTLSILGNIFQKNPSVGAYFYPEIQKVDPTLPNAQTAFLNNQLNLLQKDNFNIKLTDATYRNFYAAQYLKDLAKETCETPKTSFWTRYIRAVLLAGDSPLDFVEKNTVQRDELINWVKGATQRALMDKSVEYLKKAYLNGHPTAAWECSYHSDSQRDTLLKAALMGNSKAQSQFIRNMLESLFLSNPLNDEIFSSSLQQLLELAEIWPAGREELLSQYYNYHCIHDRINIIKAIGEGTQKTLPFLNPGNENIVELNFDKIEWPEAFLVLGNYFHRLAGTDFQTYYPYARNCFIHAYNKKAINSASTFTNFIIAVNDSTRYCNHPKTNFFQQNKSYLEDIMDNHPLLEEAYAQYGATLSNELHSINQDQDQDQITKIFNFFSNAYDKNNLRFKKPYPLMQHLTNALFFDLQLMPASRSCPIKRAFFEWMLNNPFGAHILERVILPNKDSYYAKTSLIGKWGWSLNSTSVIESSKNYNVQEEWTEIDSLFALKSLNDLKEPEVARRENCKFLLTRAIETKKEDIFERVFSEYCYFSHFNKNYFPLVNFTMLKSCLNNFLNEYPKNADLPFIFATAANIDDLIQPYSPDRNHIADATRYFQIAAKNGSEEAKKVLLAAAAEGNQEATEFLGILDRAQNGSKKDQDYLSKLKPLPLHKKRSTEPKNEQRPSKRQKKDFAQPKDEEDF